jgi:hypothetical protein
LFLNYFLGVGAALALLWVVTGVTLSSRSEQVYDEALGRITNVPGSKVEFRKEGWATSHYGKHGVVGFDDITAVPGPKVMLWGDSHVEALEVPDSEKTAAQVNRLWRERHPDGVPTAFSWGESGANLANHYFDIPRYEKVISGIERHYIVMSFTRRAFPNDPRSTTARFVERDGAYSLVEEPQAPPGAATRKLRHRLLALRGQGVYWLFGTVTNPPLLSRLRFGLGPVRQAAPRRELPAFDEAYTRRSFTWLLTRLKGQTAKPITIAYIPEIPCIVAGSISQELDTEEAERRAVLESVCREVGIGFINLEADFRCGFEATGRFPRGFNNGQPGVGHLNGYGHRLLAEAIVRDLEGGARP